MRRCTDGAWLLGTSASALFTPLHERSTVKQLAREDFERQLLARPCGTGAQVLLSLHRTASSRNS